MSWNFAQIKPGDFEVPKTNVSPDSTTTILEIVLGISGGIAVLILMIAALKYVTSQGDPAAVAKAKNTIIYTLIGLAVIAGAFGIVSFVVKQV